MNTKNKNLIRQTRIREKIKKTANGRFRLSIFRSSKNLSAQIIDDLNNKTLISASSFSKKEISKNKKKTDISIDVAAILAKKALEKKITNIYFDRGRYKYHGRIKTFAEALRKGGLIF